MKDHPNSERQVFNIYYIFADVTDDDDEDMAII
jgi:hypothetical protein